MSAYFVLFCKLSKLKPLISLEKIPSTLEDFQTQGKLAKTPFNQISASIVRLQQQKGLQHENFF